MLSTDMMNCGKLGERRRNRRATARVGTISTVVAKLWEHKGLGGDVSDRVICLNSMEVIVDPDLRTAWCQRIESRFETGFNCTKSTLKCKGEPEEKRSKHRMTIPACDVITQIEQELSIKVLHDAATDGYEYET